MFRKCSLNRLLLEVTVLLTKGLVIMLFCVPLLHVCGFRSQLRAQTQDVTLSGAGEIARCGPEKLTNAQATAALLDSIPGRVFALGDSTYPNGRESKYFQCDDVTWGRHRARTISVLGSHDTIVPTSYGSFNYFWHVPLYSSTSSPASTTVQPLWQILFNTRADLIVNGGGT